MRSFLLAALTVAVLAASSLAEERVFLASGANVSPDGSTIVTSWLGDLYRVGSEGGRMTRLTSHPATDSQPFFSPDGSEIAFVSDRDGGDRVYVMPASGGPIEAITHDTNGAALMGWFPDGEHLLVRMRTDRAPRYAYRFFRVSRTRRVAPKMLFDAWGYEARLSPDGRKVLFTREGKAWWNKGYRGPQAGQIWSYDLDSGEYRKLLHETYGFRSPRWTPDGKAFVCLADVGGCFNLMKVDIASGARTQLTRFDDDNIVTPSLSANGDTIVFRHRFDLYRFRPDHDSLPKKLELTVLRDPPSRPIVRKNLSRADDVAFSADGLEIAFLAGGDLFVMDTVLREPKRITKTSVDESWPVFLPDGKGLLFIRPKDGQGDIWRVERKDEKAYWWQTDEFVETCLSDDPATERLLSISPTGTHIAFVRGRGRLIVRDLESGEERTMVTSFRAPSYDWSPDGKWMTYAALDEDYNADVWIAPIDGSRPAVNVSMHPDSDWNPTWSPDGKILAFLSVRRQDETDIHYVWLRKSDEEESKRDRTLAEALAKMKKGRRSSPTAAKPKPPAVAPKKPTPEKPAPAKAAPAKPADPKAAPAGPADPKPETPKPATPKKLPPKPEAPAKPEKTDPPFDLDRIHERVRSISIRDVSESNLFWSPDGKRLAFVASIGGKRGVHTVSFPDDLRPKLMTSTVGSGPDWVKAGNAIRWLVRGVPTVTSASGRSTSYGFSVPHVVNVAERYGAAFDLIWRSLRDGFYDPRLNNRNWDEVRRKYRDAAVNAPDRGTFGRVVSLMLGELNGSHLGFTVSPEPSPKSPDDWRDETGHLGLRWDLEYAGPGLRIAKVLPGGPADRVDLALAPGDVVTHLDGVAVDPGLDLTTVLNGRLDRDVRLTVAGEDEKSREVSIRPVRLGALRRSLYREWLEDTEARVEILSRGRLGYVHVSGMNWGSFYEFQRRIYAAGYGKEGLVIDVRDNGGGFTADHLLTALTQPVHARTVGRGGAPGYPQDRVVYASWSKPIVVLINQNSFSNAEIFAHAIKTLGRGRLVGVQTAGGVISTGGMRIMDLGFLRTPGRGWFLIGDGEDMEQNGARPDVEIWPGIEEPVNGKDSQLAKAVEVLLEDVEKEKAKELPPPRYRSER